MKISARRSFVSFALLSILALAEAGTLRAEAELGVACLVDSPFYQKLRSAGVLDVPVLPPSGVVEPLRLLFIKARLIHYSWDKLKTEHWQSADETSRVFSGSCADKAIWLYTHLRRNGYGNASLVIGRYSPSSKVLHMWVTYEEPSGSEMLMDPTIQRKPWKATDFSTRFYKPLLVINGKSCVSV